LKPFKKIVLDEINMGISPVVPCAATATCEIGYLCIENCGIPRRDHCCANAWQNLHLDSVVVFDADQVLARLMLIGVGLAGETAPAIFWAV
jgi:hypothetical protein